MSTEASYPVLIEKSETGWAAFSPDVPGCIATGETVEHVLETMGEALQAHLEELKAMGLPVPKPRATQAGEKYEVGTLRTAVTAG